MFSIPKLNIGHQRQASVDTTVSNNSDETNSSSSNSLSQTNLMGTISSDNLISHFIEPLSQARKTNARIHWKCVHVISHPDFEKNALDDDSSYHTTLQLLPFNTLDVATQRSRFAIIHSSKKGVSVLELINELTQSTDGKMGKQWIVKYHTKLESNGFGSSAALLKKSSESKEKLVFFGGYFHENHEVSDKSSLFQSQQRYSSEAVSQNRTLTSRMKKLFKSSKGDVAACPHPSNMFFKYRFDKYEFLFTRSGEENGGSNEKSLSRKPSFMTGANSFWPSAHANHKILSVGKEIYVFGGHYMKWSELTEENMTDSDKKTSFVYIYDSKRKKFEQPKLVSFTLPKPQLSVSTNASNSSDSLLDSASNDDAPKDIPLPLENVDTKQKERRNFLLSSIKSFSRERKGSFHDGEKMMTDIRDIAPMNRFGHQVVNVNGVAYIYGGKLRKSYDSGHPDQVNPHSDDSVYSFNFRTGQFARLRIKSNEKPHPRLFHAMVEIPENNCFLMMGGQNATEKVLDDERLSMMMEESKMNQKTEPISYFDDCYVFDILRSEWSKVKQSGHLPLSVSNFGLGETDQTRVPVALSRTKDGKFLCVIKNAQGSLEIYEGESNF